MSANLSFTTPLPHTSTPFVQLSLIDRRHTRPIQHASHPAVAPSIAIKLITHPASQRQNQ